MERGNENRSYYRGAGWPIMRLVTGPDVSGMITIIIVDLGVETGSRYRYRSRCQQVRMGAVPVTCLGTMLGMVTVLR